MKTLLTTLLTALTLTLQAQNYVDLFRIDYMTSPNTSFKDGSGLQGQVKELVVDATLPIVLSDRFNIVSGFNLEKIDVDIYSTENTSTLYGLMLKAGANIQHSDGLTGTYILLPKISSDMKKIGKKDYQVGGLILLKYKAAKPHSYKFGAYVNSDLFGPMIVPIFGFYKMKNRWETNLTLPLNADLNYNPTEELKVGVKFTGINKSYHIARPLDQYVVKVNNEIGPYFQFGHKGFNIVVQGGTTVLRSYKTYRVEDRVNYAISLIRPGDNRVPLNDSFKDGLFLKTSLIYRFSLAKS